MNQPKNTYIVIVTYNGMPWLEQCLESCKGHPVVVVDNASSDETVEFISTTFPEVHIITQTKNLGFGKANNIGISYALNQGALAVFLLNQDARLLPETIATLEKTHDSSPDYGLLSPVHYNWVGGSLEFYFSKFISRSPKFLMDALEKQPLDTVYKVPFVNAAAWFIPKSTLMTVGGFDSIFHHYGEDNNYCQRLRYHNMSIGIVTGTKIFHDSKERKWAENFRFSEWYYLNELKMFLIKYGNINIDFSASDIKNALKKHKQQAINTLMRLNISEYKGLRKKYHLLNRQFNVLLEHREKNKRVAPHYLNIEILQ